MTRFVGIAALALAACSPMGQATVPDRYELANIAEGNVIPQSTPASMMRVFRDICVAGVGDTPEATTARLRSAGYVEVPGRSAGMRSFVVDDRRPLVMLSRDAGHSDCSVSAQSRTGQTQAVADMIARDFPSARPVDIPGSEQAWALGGGRTIYTIRERAAVPPAYYILAIGQ